MAESQLQGHHPTTPKGRKEERALRVMSAALLPVIHLPQSKSGTAQLFWLLTVGPQMPFHRCCAAEGCQFYTLLLLETPKLTHRRLHAKALSLVVDYASCVGGQRHTL